MIFSAGSWDPLLSIVKVRVESWPALMALGPKFIEKAGMTGAISKVSVAGNPTRVDPMTSVEMRLVVLKYSPKEVATGIFTPT